MPIKVFEPFTRLDASDVNDFLVNKGGFEFFETITFTSSGTFTKADYPDMRAIRIKVQGAGAGGAGAGATGSGQGSCGSGGGGGVYAESFITDLTSLTEDVSVTIGAGGAGGVGTGSGSDGGESSFGSLVVAPGGTGGSSRAASAFPVLIVGGDLKTGGTGQIIRQGEPGGTGIVVKQGQADGGAGANSLLGVGARGATSGNAGSNGEGFGSGGSGAANSASVAARDGGNGAAGIVIVEVFV
jgi:hypothetical protein